jgi:hypothetical protein
MLKYDPEFGLHTKKPWPVTHTSISGTKDQHGSLRLPHRRLQVVQPQCCQDHREPDQLTESNSSSPSMDGCHYNKPTLPLTPRAWMGRPFGADHKWGTITSIAGSWVVSQEPFFKSKTCQTQLSASRGLTGNQEIGNLQRHPTPGSQLVGIYLRGHQADRGACRSSMPIQTSSGSRPRRPTSASTSGSSTTGFTAASTGTTKRPRPCCSPWPYPHRRSSPPSWPT